MNQPKKSSSVKPPVLMRWRPDEDTEELRAQLAAANEALAETKARLAISEEAHKQCAEQLRELIERNATRSPR